MNRKSVLSFIALLIVTNLMQLFAQQANLQVDLFFENGIVYTADKVNTVAQCLAVKDGKIRFVGSNDEGNQYRNRAKEIIDLKGGMLLPGFIDGHIHTITPPFFDFIHFSDTTIDLILQRITQYIIAHPHQEVYYGYGFNVGVFDGEELTKGPKKERLDKICPDKPVIIYALDGHLVWLNSKGYEYCNITKNTTSPAGGEILKNELTGELWGTVQNSAMALVPDPLPAPEKLLLLLQQFQSMLHSLGYTSIMTVPGNGYLAVYWDGYKQLEQNNLLALRVRGAEILKPWDSNNDFIRIKEYKKKYNSDLLQLTAAKIFTDGIVGSKTAYLLQPYYNTTEYGEPIWSQDALNEVYTMVNKEGLAVHTHSIGDAAVKMALDAAEYAKQHTKNMDCRNAITHLQFVDVKDLPRFKALNVIPVMQPFWHFKQPGAWEPMELPLLGEERAENEYPLKSFVTHDAMPVFSSDYPVTNVPHPFYAIEIGVTRNLPDAAAYGAPDDITDMDDPKYLLQPAERLDMMTMLRGYTANAAYSISADDVTGSLEVGKAADLIVIDQNLFEIDPLKISDTKVLKTYFKGKLVFSLE